MVRGGPVCLLSLVVRLSQSDTDSMAPMLSAHHQPSS